MRGALAARCIARQRQRDAVADTVRRDLNWHAWAPARECCILAAVDPVPTSRRNRNCQNEGSPPSRLSCSLAAGQNTCVREEGFSLHTAHCDTAWHTEDSTSLPADETSLCTSRRHRCRKPELSLTRRASPPNGNVESNFQGES